MHLKVYLGKVKDYIEKNTLAYAKQNRDRSLPRFHFPQVYMGKWIENSYLPLDSEP